MADQMGADEIAEMGRRAKKRVAEEYTWDKICGQYEDVFINWVNEQTLTMDQNKKQDSAEAGIPGRHDRLVAVGGIGKQESFYKK